jgi:hypothetical protein
MVWCGHAWRVVSGGCCEFLGGEVRIRKRGWAEEVWVVHAVPLGVPSMMGFRRIGLCGKLSSRLVISCSLSGNVKSDV